jgi:hypothetical protein
MNPVQDELFFFRSYFNGRCVRENFNAHTGFKSAETKILLFWRGDIIKDRKPWPKLYISILLRVEKQALKLTYPNRNILHWWKQSVASFCSELLYFECQPICRKVTLFNRTSCNASNDTKLKIYFDFCHFFLKAYLLKMFSEGEFVEIENVGIWWNYWLVKIPILYIILPIICTTSEGVL